VSGILCISASLPSIGAIAVRSGMLSSQATSETKARRARSWRSAGVTFLPTVRTASSVISAMRRAWSMDSAFHAGCRAWSRSICDTALSKALEVSAMIAAVSGADDCSSSVSSGIASVLSISEVNTRPLTSVRASRRRWSETRTSVAKVTAAFGRHQ
jgi:hypothetical protein